MNREEPKSANKTKETKALWKLCQGLTLEEIRVLVGKRKNDLKYERNPERIDGLKREIAILMDAYEISKKKKGDY